MATPTPPNTSSQSASPSPSSATTVSSPPPSSSSSSAPPPSSSSPASSSAVSVPLPKLLYSVIPPEAVDFAMGNALSKYTFFTGHGNWYAQYAQTLTWFARMRCVSILGEGGVLLDKLDGGLANIGASETEGLDSKMRLDNQTTIFEPTITSINNSSHLPPLTLLSSAPSVSSSSAATSGTPASSSTFTTIPITMMIARKILVGYRNLYSHPILDAPIVITIPEQLTPHKRLTHKLPISFCDYYDSIPGCRCIHQCLRDIVRQVPGDFYVMYEPMLPNLGTKTLEQYCADNLGAVCQGIRDARTIWNEYCSFPLIQNSTTGSWEVNPTVTMMYYDAVEMCFIRVMNSYLNVIRAIRKHPDAKKIQDALTQQAPITVITFYEYEKTRTLLCHQFQSLTPSRISEFMGALNIYETGLNQIAKVLPTIINQFTAKSGVSAKLASTSSISSSSAASYATSPSVAIPTPPTSSHPTFTPALSASVASLPPLGPSATISNSLPATTSSTSKLTPPPKS